MILIIHRKTRKVVMFLDKENLPPLSKCILEFSDEVLFNELNPEESVFNSSFIYVKINPNYRYFNVNVGDEIDFKFTSALEVLDE